MKLTMDVPTNCHWTLDLLDITLLGQDLLGFLAKNFHLIKIRTVKLYQNGRVLSHIHTMPLKLCNNNLILRELLTFHQLLNPSIKVLKV